MVVHRAPRLAADTAPKEARRAWAWLLTLALHALALAAVVVVPLLREEPLPSKDGSTLQAFFADPIVASAPPPPPPPAPKAAATIRQTPRDSAAGFTAPLAVPSGVPQEASLDLGIEGGIPGGVDGGVPGGVVGGIVGGLDAAPPPPPRLVNVGSVVHPPRKVKDVAPVYPDVARQARIQGVVVLECTIGTNGRVEDLHVLSGLPILDSAAIEAVRQWVYTPTLLDGVPVRVLMDVTVTFALRGSLVG